MFCHLHVHTEYSMLDGYGKAEEYASRAKKLGYKYLACTDHGNIDGLITFQKQCEENGITPILGCEAYLIEDKSKNKNSGHICFWVKNNLGFKNLCSMLSIANLENFYRRPLITYQNLLDHHCGLIIGTACLNSFIHQENGEKFFREIKKLKPNEVYAEIMVNEIEEQKAHNQKVIRLAESTNTPIIFTHDCHYVRKGESTYQEMMLAIQRKAKWNDKNRWRFETTNLYLLNKNEVQKIATENNFPPEYLSNTIKLAEQCNGFKIPKRTISLPKIKGITNEAKFLKRLCIDKLKTQFGLDNKIYYDRLKMELDLILKKKFESYILIVWELCNWCRENKIMIGPGRGSVGGCLIAYLLGITSIDPIKYNLLFERFIAEDRIDFPDIDLDFERSKIDLIKKHLVDKYGIENIAGVSNYSTYKARSSVQDVARVFGIPPEEVNYFTKIIESDELSSEEELLENAIATQAGNEFNQQYPDVIKYARKITGRIRNYSQHAAAMVISPDKIDIGGRCTLIRGKDVRINWNKYDIEHVGYIKLDVLRLRLLSIIGMTLDQIRRKTGREIDLNTIDMNNRNILNQIQQNHNEGVFQLNTWATKKLLEELKVENFESLIHCVALVRPGPNESGITEQYIERQRTKTWEKKHQIYENLTSETYGLVIFQEQIMAVISKIAGLPYSTADKIRKVISKKRERKYFAEYEQSFLKGCKKEKLFSDKEAEEFWEALLFFSRYGFNKAHATGYAILAYWCAFLKFHHPVEFISSALTYGAKEKKSDLIQEAYRLGLNVIPPKVGKSDSVLWLSQDNDLMVPFSEIKGMGEIKAKKAAIPPHLEKIQGKLKFFTMQNLVSKHSGQLGDLLTKINAYSQDNLSSEAKQLFDFEIRPKPEKIKKLLKKNVDNQNLTCILNGDVEAIQEFCKPIIFNKEKVQTYVNMNCESCSLSQNSGYPINPTPGSKNIMIIGEAPGKAEYVLKKPFVGKSGKLLWKYLSPLKRDFFHVTNTIKCFPVNLKIENEHIQICTKNYLEKEINSEKPKIILAIGNKALNFFTGKEKGIVEQSGKIFWNEQYNCFICYLLHPAAVLRNEEIYLDKFKESIQNFKELYKALNGKK